MTSGTEQFDIALGTCTIRDRALVIERADPEQMGRLELFRKGLATSLEYRPWFTGAILAGMGVFGLIFVSILVSLYTSNPAVAPLVGVLGFFGVLGIVVPLEVSYRRALSERRDLRSALAEEFPLVQADHVPLDEITRVTERTASTGLFLEDGRLFLVHFQQNGEDAVTSLGFPEFMSEERATARSLFDAHGTPVREQAQQSSERSGPEC